MRALIIEDEAHSSKTLLNFLSKYCPSIEVAGVASNVETAVQAISEYNPELLFLDIDLPDGSGFDVLDSLEIPWPKVIFVTAYNQYAIKAFQISAVDYLLKPVDPELLMKAVEKAVEQPDSAELENKKMDVLRENRRSGNLNRMALPTQNGVQLVKTDQIVRLEADGNYTTVYLQDKTRVVVSRKIKDFEAWLEDLPFFRIHQSHIVNLQMIDRYIKGEGGTVIMEDGSQLEVARRRKDDFLKRIMQ